MIINSIPQGPLVDQKGYMTADWKEFFSQFFVILQNTLSDNGTRLPFQTTDNITELNTVNLLGALLYNTDTNKVMANINGTFKEVITI
jgi:hypothetical protein